MYFIYGIAATTAAIYAGSMKWVKSGEVCIKSQKVKKPVRILHISDVHGNSAHKLNINIYKKIDRLKFDFIVITGDMVQKYSREFEPHRKYIKHLAEKYKVYYVDGNHEKYIYTEFKKILESLSVRVLCNETDSIIVNGNKLSITGVRDLYLLKKRNIDPNTIIPTQTDTVYSILLSHQPQIIDCLSGNTPDLTLCGHTHAGQVRFPFFPALYAPGQGFLPKYDHGLYKNGSGFMFVSRGIGATDFNIRFYNRPEISVINIEPDA